jgi:hypothetical protein
MKRFILQLERAVWKATLLVFISVACTCPALAQNSTWYVWQGSATNGPGTNWAYAFHDIQSAVDAAASNDIVLVTNGVYSTGARVDSGGISNRVLVSKALTVESVNGFGVTTVQGDSGTRCVYLTNGSRLSGFTLTGGNAGGSDGGGVYCTASTAQVSSCVISNNSADYGGGVSGGNLSYCSLVNNGGIDGFEFSPVGGGGGAYQSILSNCIINGNVADGGGGGAYNCTLNNCTLSGNEAGHGGGAFGGILNECTVEDNGAEFGGGAYDCNLNNCTLVGNSFVFTSMGYQGSAAGAYGGTLINCTVSDNSSVSTYGGVESAILNNCIVFNNTAPMGFSNYNSADSRLNYCCTMPFPSRGIGNITNAPLFVNEGGGDYHLQARSPCINSGKNVYVNSTNDLDGNPRTVAGTVDMGAYEYQMPTSVISYAWLEQYGFPIDGSSDFVDSDGSGMNHYQDWVAGLIPTNASSVLAVVSAMPTKNPSGIVVTWQSVANISYNLVRSTSLTAPSAFATIQSNIIGSTGTTSFTDTNAFGPGPFYYCIGVNH